MKKEFDILGLGCTAVDDLLYVAGYPAADSKVEVKKREQHCGGLCATALVAGARLGARCAYAGMLGDDDGSQFVRETLEREGVNLRHLVRSKSAGPVRSMVIVDEARRTRTLFYDASKCCGAHPIRPEKGVILSANVLLVDRFGIPGMIRAARLARAHGIPVVADFESSRLPRFRTLLQLTDHLIVSQHFACALTKRRTPAAAATDLWNEDRAVVIVTCGAAGCWFLDRFQTRPRRFRTFHVRSVDTTGCGDVFHGAYAAALARGLALKDRLRFASAAAALKSEGHGGQQAIPSLRRLEQFLEQKPAEERSKPSSKPEEG